MLLHPTLRRFVVETLSEPHLDLISWAFLAFEEVFKEARNVD
jgi:hypothetical protein